MSDQPIIPAPRYTLIDGLRVCLATALRALTEVRSLGVEIREFMRIPGPEGKRGPKGEAGEKGDRGEQGKQGPPGRDGGYDKIEQIDESEYYGHRYLRDGVVLEEHRWQKPKADISLLAEAYKDVWKEGQYEAGSLVTHRGHLWMARMDTTAQPDTAPEEWRMVMRKPRDGRNGEKGERGIQGAKGERGEPGPRGYGG